MKKEDVPQDRGIIDEYGYELCYAVNRDGEYDLVPSLGWEPKNIANHQAWEVIDREVSSAIEGLKRNELSPIAFYMAKHQMDTGLVAGYTGFYQWQVRRHINPRGFNGLNEKKLMIYADVFKVSLEELKSPDLTTECGEQVAC